jgi:hypothetical protein
MAANGSSGAVERWERPAQAAAATALIIVIV